jgi:hypothetical protein
MKKSMNPNTESTPRHRHMKKKMTEKKLAAGSRLIRAGNTTKSRSGPDLASSKTGMFFCVDTCPRNVKMVSEA